MKNSLKIWIALIVHDQSPSRSFCFALCEFSTERREQTFRYAIAGKVQMVQKMHFSTYRFNTQQWKKYVQNDLLLIYFGKHKIPSAARWLILFNTDRPSSLNLSGIAKRKYVYVSYGGPQLTSVFSCCHHWFDERKLLMCCTLCIICWWLCFRLTPTVWAEM